MEEFSWGSEPLCAGGVGLAGGVRILGSRGTLDEEEEQ